MKMSHYFSVFDTIWNFFLVLKASLMQTMCTAHSLHEGSFHCAGRTELLFPTNPTEDKLTGFPVIRKNYAINLSILHYNPKVNNPYPVWLAPWWCWCVCVSSGLAH